MLEEDALRFDAFLKENDEKVQEAIKHADTEAKAKQDKVCSRSRPFTLCWGSMLVLCQSAANCVQLSAAGVMAALGPANAGMQQLAAGVRCTWQTMHSVQCSCPMAPGQQLAAGVVVTRALQRRWWQ